MKVRFINAWGRPHGKSYAVGDEEELPREVAESLIALGIAEKTEGGDTITVKLKETHKEGNVEYVKGSQVELDRETAESLIAEGKAEQVATAADLRRLIAEASESLKATVQQAVAEGVAGGLKSVKSDGKGGLRITGAKDLEIDEDPRQGYQNFGEFVKDVKAFGTPGQQPGDGLMKIAAFAKQHGMSEGVGAEGGFLVPPDFSNRMLERAEAVLDIMGQCDNVTVRGNSVDVTAYIDHDRSGTTYRYAGLVPYWVAEAGQITRSKLKIREVHIELHKLACLVPVTDELIEDTDGLAERVTRKVGDAIGEEAVYSILFGTGVGQPLGAFIGAEAGTDHGFYAIAKEGGQAPKSIVAENILKMWQSLYKAQGGWYYNPECFVQLATMTIDVGTAGIPVWLPANGLANQPNETIFGAPARRTDLCKALGTMGDIVAADWSHYLLARKGGIKTALSIHLWFDYAETALRSLFRIGGQPAWDKALTPRAGSILYSPFIALRTRA